MKNFIVLDNYSINQYVNHRHGETKIGETLQIVENVDQLSQFLQQYVIVGLPEDIGVIANHGNEGTAKTWSSFLQSFLNIQQNRFTKSNNFLILGHLDFSNFYNQLKKLDKNHPDYTIHLGKIVEEIDKVVTKIIYTIVSQQKIPILIGGGHNNAYGIIQGVYKYINQPINVLNIDAHTDLRNTEYRHSGNGFSYALEKSYLDKYYIFGLHKNYTPESIFEYMDSNKKIQYICYEDMLHLNDFEKLSKLKAACNILKGDFGLEIDCDSIQNFSSSAMTPSGFSVDQMRSMINMLKNNTLKYIHICEAIPSPTTSKALSYFVSDLLR